MLLGWHLSGKVPIDLLLPRPESCCCASLVLMLKSTLYAEVRQRLLIREKQITAFEAGAKDAFRSRVADFVREHHSGYVDDLTGAEMLAFVDDVIASGAEFGCDSDRDYMLFSTPCAIYGARSMRDPIFECIYFAPLEWTGARVKRPIDSMMDSLSQVLDAEFAEVSGAQLLRRLRGTLFPDGAPRARRLPAASQLSLFCEKLFPSRMRRLTAAELEAHFSRSQEAAQRIGLSTPEGILVYQQIAYFIGCEFAWDGLYPWAIKALAKDVSEAARLRRLETAVKVITDRAAAAG